MKIDTRLAAGNNQNQSQDHNENKDQDKNKISVEKLSLPKGGGAINGINEKVTIQDFTGSASFTLPIPVSACRRIAPSLEVSYNSTSGNSEFGLGWSINVLKITRKTNKGVPLYGQVVSDYGPSIAQDTFLLGSQDLVPTGDTKTAELNNTIYSVTNYCVKHEGNFSLIEYWQPSNSAADDSSNSFWQITSRDHSVSILGYTSQAKIADPNNSTHVFAWLLEESYSLIGDHQLWFYKQEDGANVPNDIYEQNRNKTANQYLTSVRYGHDEMVTSSLLLTSSLLVTDASLWHFEVVFNYGEYNINASNPDPYTPVSSWGCRDDPFSRYNAGFEIRNYRLCQNSLMFHRFAELGNSDSPRLVQAVSYNYQNDGAGINQLVSSTSTGYQYDITANTYTTASLPAMEFSYTKFKPQDGQFEPVVKATSVNSADIISVISTINSNNNIISKSVIDSVGSNNTGSTNNSNYNIDSNNRLSLSSLRADNELPFIDEMATKSLVDLYGTGIVGVLYQDQANTYYATPKLLETEYEHNSNDRPTALYNRKQPSIGAAGANTGIYIQNQELDFEVARVNPFPVQQGQDRAYYTIMDVTGNGKPDLMLISDNKQGYWQATATAKDNWQEFKAFESFPAGLIVSQTFVDMTGNGLNDLVQITDTGVTTYPSLGATGFGPPIIINRENNPKDLPTELVAKANRLVMFKAIDGSGKQQLVDIELKVKDQVGTLLVSYFPNLGYGKFGARVTMDGLPIVNQNFDCRSLFIVDLDGSGTGDLVYVRPGEAIVYLNQNGNSFNNPVAIALPTGVSVTDYRQVTFADLKSRGTNCLIISESLDSKKAKEFYYDFCQGQKPYLIETTDNNMGATTHLTYRSSVDFYLSDKKADFTWLTNIPFPIMVVSHITTKDALSGSIYTKEYSYHHGYYDSHEREFRGFGRVDVQDAEYFPGEQQYTLPSVVRTWYHVGNKLAANEGVSKQYTNEYYQGDIDALLFEDSVITIASANNNSETRRQAYTALAGVVLRSELYGLKPDGVGMANPYSVSENNYYVYLHQPIGTNKYAVFTTEPRSTISYDYERNSQDPKISQQCSFFDNYSNLVSSISIDYPRRKSKDATTTPIPGQGLKATANTVSYIAPNLQPNSYLIGVSCENKSFDVTSLLRSPAIEGEAYSFDQLQAVITNVTDGLLLSWNQIYYASFSGSTQSQTQLPLGQAALPVLVYQTQTAAFSPTDSYAFSGILNTNEFAAQLQAGYYKQDKISSYWFAPSNVTTYDANNFYLPLQVTDQAGNSTSYAYDVYHLLLVSTKDALGNTAISKDLNYQLLLATTAVDINGNTSQATYDPLGRVIYTTFYGNEYDVSTNRVVKVGFADISQAPNIQVATIDQIIASPATYLGNMASYFYYDSFAFKDRKEPVHTLTITAELYPNAQDQILHMSISYIDGLARTIQAKANSEEGLAWQYNANARTVAEISVATRWLTSGAVVYDNKGNTIKAYEPYYSDTSHYLSPDKVLRALINKEPKFGITPVFHYDPLDRLYQIITPKGLLIEENMTSWTETSYDENDTCDGSSPYCQANLANSLDENDHYYDAHLPDKARRSLTDMHHHFGITADYVDSPLVEVYDNQGNILISKQHVTPAQDPTLYPNGEDLLTYATYDIKGNMLTTADPRLSKVSQANFTNTYGFAGQVLKVLSIDAGTKWALDNVFGNPMFSCDARGITTTSTYDALQRVVSTTVVKTGTTADPLAINQVISYCIYGDTPNAITNPSQYNLRGQLYMHYDQAGLVTAGSYSLTGDALNTKRQFLTDYTQLPNWNMPINTNALQTKVYAESVSYNAIGRIKSKTDVDGNITTPTYNLAGLLKELRVITSNNNHMTAYVKSIIYNAKGQRLQITYGNDTKTSYTYDQKTFAVTRIYTTNNAGGVLQDINYTYNLIGNILTKTDNAQDVVYYNNQQVTATCTYTYDSIHRLISATGRQQTGFISNEAKSSLALDNDLYQPYRAASDLQALENYLEEYTYDDGGNMLTLSHTAASASFTRNYVVSKTTNRSVISTLRSNITSDNVDNYFDRNGNQLVLASNQDLTWNEHNNIQATILIKRPNNKNDAEYYVYDASGNRVRKINQTYGTGQITANITETIYLGGIEIHRTSQQTQGNTSTIVKSEYHTLSISDDTNTVVNHRYWTVGAPPAGISNPCTYYSLTDHLGSCILDVDTTGKVVTVEEYTPYAMSCITLGFGAAQQLKTKRYSGKEKDATGLYYYGARYLSSTSCRWMSVDPIGPVDGPNIYLFLNQNPINGVDVNGNVKSKNGKNNKLLSTNSGSGISKSKLTPRTKKSRSFTSKHKNTSSCNLGILSMLYSEHVNDRYAATAQISSLVASELNNNNKITNVTGAFHQDIQGYNRVNQPSFSFISNTSYSAISLSSPTSVSTANVKMVAAAHTFGANIEFAVSTTGTEDIKGLLARTNMQPAHTNSHGSERIIDKRQVEYIKTFNLTDYNNDPTLYIINSFQKPLNDDFNEALRTGTNHNNPYYITDVLTAQHALLMTNNTFWNENINRFNWS